jgi:hypothetical protein
LYGSVLVTGGGDGKIKFWKFPDMSEAERKKKAERKKQSIPDKEDEIRHAQERKAALDARRRADAEAKVAAAKLKHAHAKAAGTPTEVKGSMGRKEDVSWTLPLSLSLSLSLPLLSSGTNEAKRCVMGLITACCVIVIVSVLGASINRSCDSSSNG